MAKKRKQYDEKLKATILDKVDKGQMTVAEASTKFGVNQFIIYGWRRSAAKKTPTNGHTPARRGPGRPPRLGLPPAIEGVTTTEQFLKLHEVHGEGQDQGFAYGVSLGRVLHKIESGARDLMAPLDEGRDLRLDKQKLKQFGDDLRAALRVIDGA
jgi:transposase-like protein